MCEGANRFCPVCSTIRCFERGLPCSLSSPSSGWRAPGSQSGVSWGRGTLGLCLRFMKASASVQMRGMEPRTCREMSAATTNCSLTITKDETVDFCSPGAAAPFAASARATRRLLPTEGEHLCSYPSLCSALEK
eukprot:767704-Hanusia_phi.AAC.5